MRKKLWYGAILIVIFVAVIAVMFLRGRNSGDKDRETSVMGKATLPIVYPCYEDIRINALHGYVGGTDISSVRDTLTPLKDDRLLTVQIDTYGAKVTGISYEIRTLDMSRMLEKTGLAEWDSSDGIITALFEVENLLTAGEEYHLIIRLATDTQKEICYYTRLIQGVPDMAEKLAYVIDFHERTFDREAALTLVNYLESGSKGDNTNYGSVNIYSSFQQITWGELDVKRIGESRVSLKDINGNISYFNIEYLVSIPNMYGTDELYRVTEFYRTRHTSARTYLLSFERTMEQYFTPVTENLYNNKINLGIAESAETAITDRQESPSGKTVCFVRSGELWSYNSTTHTLAKVFSFEGDEKDVRTMWGKHGIRIAGTDDGGNITFMVYGYMSRGRHEGEVGISVFRYSAADKNAEELLYISYDKSFDMLSESIGRLCYINSSSWLYFILEGSLYAIDITGREYVVTVNGLTEDRYVVNGAGNTLVWQNGGKYDASEIKVLNLETGEEWSISCGEEESLMLLSYMEDDIVYGTAKKENIVSDISGGMSCYMYKLNIVDENKNNVGTYEKDGIFIKSVEFSEGMITINRASQNDDGEYEDIAVDYLTRNTSGGKPALGLSVAATELKKKEVLLNLSVQVGSGRLTVEETDAVHFREDNELVLNAGGTSEEERYYVYAKGRFIGSFTDAAAAISGADGQMGLVIDRQWRYIWKRGNVYASRRLSDITVQPDEDNSLAACLDGILKNIGVITSSAKLLAEGASVEQIMESSGAADCLYLNGVSLERVLYCVNAGRPVAGRLSEGEYVIITGYDSKYVTLLSGSDGSSLRLGLNEAARRFEEEGNSFFSYIPRSANNRAE